MSNDKAFETARLLAKVEGIPGGISTGANLAAATQGGHARGYGRQDVVTFAPSCAERYFSSELFVDPPAKA